MSKPHKHCKEIHAFADGGEIELLCALGHWNTDVNPSWNTDFRYRIKRKTVKVQLHVHAIDKNWYIAFNVDNKIHGEWSPCSEIIEIEVTE